MLVKYVLRHAKNEPLKTAICPDTYLKYVVKQDTLVSTIVMSRDIFHLMSFLFWPVIVVVINHVSGKNFASMDIRHGDISFINQH